MRPDEVTAAAVTVIRIVSMKTSKALTPKAQPATQITSPTVKRDEDDHASRASSATVRLTLFTALKAVLIALSAPESCGGQHARAGA